MTTELLRLLYQVWLLTFNRPERPERESIMKKITIENTQAKRKFSKVEVGVPETLKEWTEIASSEAIYRRGMEAITIAFRHTDGSQKAMDNLLKGIKNSRSSAEKEWLISELSKRPDALPAEFLEGMKVSSLRDLGAVFNIKFKENEK